jgi:hypothetical protein
MPCGSCGFSNESGIKFCGGCGAPLGAVPATATAKFASPDAYTPEMDMRFWLTQAEAEMRGPES